MAANRNEAYLFFVQETPSSRLALAEKGNLRRCKHERLEPQSDSYLRPATRSRRLGRLDSVLVVSMPPTRLRRLELDKRSHRLLSLVDGRLSVREVLAASSLPQAEAWGLLAQLVERGVVGLRTH